jgi:hypothetical protein
MCEYWKLKTENWKLKSLCEMSRRNLKIEMSKYWKLKFEMSEYWKFKLKCLNTKKLKTEMFKYWKLKCLNTEKKIEMSKY